MLHSLSQIQSIISIKIPEKDTTQLSPLAAIFADFKQTGELHVSGRIILEEQSYPVGSGPALLFVKLKDSFQVYQRNLTEESRLWDLRGLPSILTDPEEILTLFSTLERCGEHVFFKK